MDVDGSVANKVDAEGRAVHMTARGRRKEEKQDKPTTLGAKWFNMPKAELTAKAKNDLRIIALRQHLDPKTFYKKDSKSKRYPDFFQIGTVVEGAGEFYSSRIKKKDRRQHLVDEVLSDINKKKTLKRKYEQIQKAKQSAGRGGRKKQQSGGRKGRR